MCRSASARPTTRHSWPAGRSRITTPPAVPTSNRWAAAVETYMVVPPCDSATVIVPSFSGSSPQPDAAPPASMQVHARESVGILLEQRVKPSHGRFSNAAILSGPDVLEDHFLGLVRLFLLGLEVNRVVHAPMLRPAAIVLEQTLPDDLRQLDDLGLEQGGRTERGGPRHVVGQLTTILDQRGRLREWAELLVHVAGVSHVIADPPVQLQMIGGRPDLAPKVSKILDEEVPGAILANLELIAARMDAAEDPGEVDHNEIVLGHVPPGLGPRQRPRSKPLEIFRFAIGAHGQQLVLQPREPFMYVRH